MIFSFEIENNNVEQKKKSFGIRLLFFESKNLYFKLPYFFVP